MDFEKISPVKFWMILIGLAVIMAVVPSALGWVSASTAIWSVVVGFGSVAVLRAGRWWSRRRESLKKKPSVEKFDDTEADVISLDDSRGETIRDNPSNPAA